MAGNTEPKPSSPNADDVETSQTTDVETQNEKVEDDEFVVYWEEPADQDPENPQSWSSLQKWTIIGIVSFVTFLTPLASSMLAPGVPLILADFGSTNSKLATFVVSIFVLGFAFGPLVVAPLSELYGRSPVYHVSNVLFTIFTAACGLSTNMGMLIAFRFLAGFAGVTVVTCGSGTIADLMPPEKRGAAMAIWSVGPLLGPVIGPVCAGFLVEAKGWEWVFWIITIFAGTATILCAFLLKETYAPVLLARKAARLRKETGNPAYRSKLQPLADGSPRQLFLLSILRPARMFIFSPVVALMCIYLATLYGLLYILFTTFTFVFSDVYGFSARGAGLSFIAGGVGNLFGLAYVGIMSDRMVKAKEAESADGKASPEARLHPILTVPGTLCLPAGLIMYGWTADQRVHWIAPMIGTAIMGFGMIIVLMSVQTYLVDSYSKYAASVTAANTVLRSLLGALLPLFGLEMYDGMGLGWGNTLLGLIALALAPVTWVLSRYGERVRLSKRFRQDF